MESFSDASVFGQSARHVRREATGRTDRLSDEIVAWADEVRAALRHFLALPKGWDGYRGVPTRDDVAKFAVTVLGEIASSSTPAPSLVPLSGGGLQIEWHTEEADIELKVLAPFSVEAWVSDPTIEDDEGRTELLDWDYSFLKPWIEKLG